MEPEMNEQELDRLGQQLAENLAKYPLEPGLPAGFADKVRAKIAQRQQRAFRIRLAVLSGTAAALMAAVLIYIAQPRPAQPLPIPGQTAQITKQPEPMADITIPIPPAAAEVNRLMLDCLASANDTAQENAKTRIINQFGAEAFTPLMHALNNRFGPTRDKSETIQLQALALDLLGRLIAAEPKLGRREELLNALIRLSADEKIRPQAIGLLARIAEPRAANQLIKYADDSALSATVLSALERMGSSAHPYLVRLLYSEDESVKMNALQAVGSLKVKSALPVIISQLENRKMRPALIETLSRMASPEAVIPLFELAKNPELKPLIDQAIRQIGPEAIPYLEPYLTAPDDNTRCRAIGLIANLENKKIVPYMIAALTDRKSRPTAEQSLQRITGQDFGGDQKKWNQWWQKNKSGKIPPDKKSGLNQSDGKI